MEYRQNRSDIMESLFKAIEVVADKSVKSYKQDITIDAEINEIRNVENGEYKVLYQGNIFSAFSSDPTVTYKKGERVYVLVPQGDYSAKKIIMGRSSYQNNDTYKSRQALTNFFVEQGENWLDLYRCESPLLICSVPKEDKETLPNGVFYADYGFTRAKSEGHVDFEDDSSDPTYRSSHLHERFLVDYMTMTPEELATCDETLARYSLTHEYIKMSATFKTDFVGNHTKGTYALVLRIRETNPLYVPENDPGYDPEQKPFIIVEYKLGFSSFVGAPYSYVVPTTQTAYFYEWCLHLIIIDR